MVGIQLSKSFKAKWKAPQCLNKIMGEDIVRNRARLGDVLNIMLIINDKFYERSYQIFNPRNAMQISRNDGKFNNQVNHQRDTIINTNTMIRLGRGIYSQSDIENIKRIKSKSTAA